MRQSRDWDARHRSDGKQTTSASGEIEKRPGYGSVRIDLFIEDEEISFFGYKIHGDGRGPSPSAGLSESRAIIDLDFESGKASVDFNVSCKDTSCDDAYEVNLEVVQLGYLTDEGLDRYLTHHTASGKNGVRIIDGGDGRIWIVVHGKISVGPPGGGTINGQIKPSFDEGGQISGTKQGNTFPSYEAYQTGSPGQRDRIFYTQNGNPGDLYDGPTGLMADLTGFLPGVPFR